MKKRPSYEAGDRWHQVLRAKDGAFTETWYDARARAVHVRDGKGKKGDERARADVGPAPAIYALRRERARAEAEGKSLVPQWRGSADATRELWQLADRAIVEGGLDRKKVTRLLRKGADPMTRDLSPGFPLFVCARFGEVDTARALVEAGAEVDPAHRSLIVADLPGSTPLVLAMANQKPDVARALLELGADVSFDWVVALGLANDRLEEGVGSATPSEVRWAKEEARETYGGAIELLLAHGADAKHPAYARWKALLATDPNAVRDELLALASPKALRDPKWPERVARALEGRNRAFVIQKVLGAPAAPRASGWADAVLRALELQPTYSAVAKDVYEQAIAYRDDEEGSLRDEWRGGAYTDLPLIARHALGAPAAKRHARIEELAGAFVSACARTDFFPAAAFRRFAKSLGPRGRAVGARFDETFATWKRRVGE